MNTLISNAFSIKNKSAYRFNYSIEIIILLALCLIFRIYFHWNDRIVYHTDSVTYYYAAQHIFRGVIDPFRTPVYPMIIRVFQAVNDFDPFPNMVRFQHFISFLSIIPFYYSCKLLFQNKHLIYIAALVYGCFPDILGYNKTIFPESILISSFVVLFYIFSAYIVRPTHSKVALLNFYIFYLVMIKPGCIYLYGVVGFFWILKLILDNDRKQFKYPLLGFIASIVLLTGYCSINKIQNNYFGISLVTHDNNFLNVIESNAYTTFEDERLISIIDTVRNHGTYYAIYYLNNDHDLIQKQYSIFPYPFDGGMNFVSNIPTSPYGYTKEQLDIHINKAIKTSVFSDYIKRNYYKFLHDKLFYLKGFIIQLLLSIEFCLIIFYAVFRNKILWQRLFITLCITGMLAVFLIAGYGQMDRIIIPVVPLLIVFVFKFIDVLLLIVFQKN